MDVRIEYKGEMCRLIDSHENGKGSSASVEPFSRGAHCFVPYHCTKGMHTIDLNHYNHSSKNFHSPS